MPLTSRLFANYEARFRMRYWPQRGPRHARSYAGFYRNGFAYRRSNKPSRYCHFGPPHCPFTLRVLGVWPWQAAQMTMSDILAAFDAKETR